jgi:hypothetical protein
MAFIFLVMMTGIVLGVVLTNNSTSSSNTKEEPLEEAVVESPDKTLNKNAIDCEADREERLKIDQTFQGSATKNFLAIDNPSIVEELYDNAEAFYKVMHMTSGLAGEYEEYIRSDEMGNKVKKCSTAFDEILLKFKTDAGMVNEWAGSKLAVCIRHRLRGLGGFVKESMPSTNLEDRKLRKLGMQTYSKKLVASCKHLGIDIDSHISFLSGPTDGDEGSEGDEGAVTFDMLSCVYCTCSLGLANVLKEVAKSCSQHCAADQLTPSDPSPGNTDLE